VTSPFVGTFYRKPNPDSPNYVSVHDKIDKGQVLCIVEAMKLMNEIEAGRRRDGHRDPRRGRLAGRVRPGAIQDCPLICCDTL